MTSTLFFILSKTVGLLIRGETLLIGLLAIGLIALWRGKRRLALAATALALAAIVALTVLPVGYWAMRPLDTAYPVMPTLASPPDGIVVLGGAVETRTWRETGQVHLNDSAERLTEAAVLAHRYPKARIVLAGGGATLSPLGDEIPAEATVMAALLTDLGIDPTRLILEKQSRNTAGNAEFSLTLAKPQPGETWLLLTSASHMPRAMQTFRRAGWPQMEAWPVDLTPRPGAIGTMWDLPLNLYYLNRAVKEYVGAIAYAVAARF